MSNHNAPADRRAMPAERPTHLSLLEVVDEINAIRSLSEAAWMAAGSIAAVEEAGPMQGLLDVVNDRLKAVRDSLNVIRLRISEAAHG